MTDTTEGTPTETVPNEQAIEIGLQHIMRYLPAGTVMPDPPPAEVVAIAEKIGLNVLGRYVPSDNEPFNEQVAIAEAIEAIPPAPPPKTFQELKAEMEASLAAEAAPLTPEQQAAQEMEQVRYTPPPPGPSFQEQVAAMNLEVSELTEEQKAEEMAKAERYAPPPAGPTFQELKEQVDKQLEEQRQADLAKLLGQTPAT